MLLRFARSFTDVIRKSNYGVTQQERLTKNMQILNDDMNYTLNRVSRVVRAYFFLGILPLSINWNKDPDILKSITKIHRMVKHFDPELLNVLIVNLGTLKIYSNEIWDELEIVFLKKSFRYVTPNNLANLSDAFQEAQRKNSEIWKVLEDLIMNENFNLRLLDGKQIALTYKSFALINQGSDQLFSKLHDNIKTEINNIGIGPLIYLLRGFHARNKTDPIILDQIIARGLLLIPLSADKSYENLLRFSLFLNASEERIHQIEKMYLNNLDLHNIYKQSRTILYYLSDNILPSQNRIEFLKKMLENFLEKEGKLMATESNERNRIFCKASLIYVPFKFGIEIPDIELVNTYNLIGDKSNIYHDKLQEIHLEVENYLKEKQLI